MRFCIAKLYVYRAHICLPGQAARAWVQVRLDASRDFRAVFRECIMRTSIYIYTCVYIYLYTAA